MKENIAIFIAAVFVLTMIALGFAAAELWKNSRRRERKGMNTDKLLQTINTQGSAAAIAALKAECQGPSDILFVERDVPHCNATSPELLDDWNDPTITQCWRPAGHTGLCCGTDGANGWLYWQKA